MPCPRSSNDITTQIQAGKGSIGKMIYDQTLYNKMDATISSAQTLMDRAEQGEGTIGKLMVDETLYNRTCGNPRPPEPGHR